MAAAARPPGIGDARVPCPLCGGLIHPVAGRCKHCKEDLSSFRSGRPQAAAVLPALNGKPVAPPPAPIVTPVAGHGTSVHAATPAAPVAINGEGSAPILPQRTTGRSMSAQRPRGGLLRNWPMIVIILAMLAIVTAVVIMVLPTDRKGGGKRQLMPAPAPDRMETMPDKSDPWASPNGPQGHNHITPPDPDPLPRITPDPPRAPNDPDPNDPDDLYGGLNMPSNPLAGMSTSFFLNMADAACKKLKTCPGADKSMTDMLCDQLAHFPKPIVSSCASGQRCLEAIDKLDCDAATSGSSINPMSMMMSVQDCTRAITEC